MAYVVCSALNLDSHPRITSGLWLSIRTWNSALLFVHFKLLQFAIMIRMHCLGFPGRLFLRGWTGVAGLSSVSSVRFNSTLCEFEVSMDSLNNDSDRFGRRQVAHSQDNHLVFWKRSYSVVVTLSQLMCTHVSHSSHWSARWFLVTVFLQRPHGCLGGPGLQWTSPLSSIRSNNDTDLR